jgi:hypothetical protein
VLREWLQDYKQAVWAVRGRKPVGRGATKRKQPERPKLPQAVVVWYRMGILSEVRGGASMAGTETRVYMELRVNKTQLEADKTLSEWAEEMEIEGGYSDYEEVARDIAYCYLASGNYYAYMVPIYVDPQGNAEMVRYRTGNFKLEGV